MELWTKTHRKLSALSQRCFLLLNREVFQIYSRQELQQIHISSASLPLLAPILSPVSSSSSHTHLTSQVPPSSSGLLIAPPIQVIGIRGFPKSSCWKGMASCCIHIQIWRWGGKRRERKIAKLATFTQHDFALIQTCELHRVQNKRKQMCPSHQQLYYY